MEQNAFRPRDLLNKDVAGICGVARLTDALSEGAWVLQNYGKASRVLLILNMLGALVFTVISIGINQLED